MADKPLAKPRKGIPKYKPQIVMADAHAHSFIAQKHMSSRRVPLHLYIPSNYSGNKLWGPELRVDINDLGTKVKSSTIKSIHRHLRKLAKRRGIKLGILGTIGAMKDGR